MTEYSVYLAQNKLEAEMIVEMLKNEGIYAYYRNDSASQLFEYRRADISQQQMIIVDERDADAAREILDVNIEGTSFEDKDEDYDYDKFIKIDQTVLTITAVIIALVLGVSLIGLFVLR